MLRSLECPNCRAAVDFDEHGSSTITKCDFCRSTIVIPEELLQNKFGRSANFAATDRFNEIVRLARQGNQSEAIRQLSRETGLDETESAEIIYALTHNQAVHWATQLDTTTTPAVRGGSRLAGCLFTLFFISIVAAVAAFFLVPQTSELQIDELASFITEVSNEPAKLIVSSPVPSTATPEPTPAFFSEVMSVDSGEGTGAGFFNDTRWVGIDGDGNLYTADYSDGRVQVFDEAGNFQMMWNADVPIISGFAVGKDGTVYIARGNNLMRYDGATGEALSPLPLPDRIQPENMYTAPDGTIHVLSESLLLQFSADGTLLTTAPGPAEQIPDYYSPYGDIAVDGAGNRYIVGDETVYKLAADGRVILTIGSRGQAEDQFGTSPTAVAVDGAGRIYAGSSVEILVFDSNGRFLDRVPINGVTFDMLFDTDNTLVVMNRNDNKLVRYQLNR